MLKHLPLVGAREACERVVAEARKAAHARRPGMPYFRCGWFIDVVTLLVISFLFLKGKAENLVAQI